MGDNLTLENNPISKENLLVIGCMRRLLKNRFILKSMNEKWFQTILDHRIQIQKHMDTLGVSLDINESLGVAHIKPISDENEEAINFQIGRRKVLTPMASLLLLQLRIIRHQVYMNPSEQIIPMMQLRDLREFVNSFNSYKIDSQFERAFRKGIEELLELQIIKETQNDETLFEITPLCELLLPIDQIQEVLAKAKNYFKQNQNSETSSETSIENLAGEQTHD
jgi:hypothetical protein